MYAPALIVLPMSGRAMLLAIAALFAWAPVVPADSLSPLPPPTFDIPFDDVDPAVTQAELARQIAAFLAHVGAHWGTSPESVRGTVAGTIERDDRSALVYARVLADHPVLEGYEFRDGTLIGGRLLVLQRPVNGLNEFIDYYRAVKMALTESYGPPAQDETVWDNDLYRPLPEYWGVAVQIGHLRYAAQWETGDGTLSLELTGHHHCRLTVEYHRKEPIDNSRTA